MHSENNGDIHFNLYIPKSYDGSKAYALFITLPGYEGLYFQGVGVNIRQENFGFEAQKYNANTIIAAPQLNGWDEDSAEMTNTTARNNLKMPTKRSKRTRRRRTFCRR